MQAESVRRMHDASLHSRLIRGRHLPWGPPLADAGLAWGPKCTQSWSSGLLEGWEPSGSQRKVLELEEKAEDRNGVRHPQPQTPPPHWPSSWSLPLASPTLANLVKCSSEAAG